MRDRIRDDVRIFAGDIGSRSPLEGPPLTRAAEAIESVWQGLGYTVQVDSYTLGSVEVRNLEVIITGRDRTAGCGVVGAHYDTVPGTPGADDNASGVALLLELSRALRTRVPRHDIRLAAFVCEEPPYFRTNRMGSLRYARALRESGVKVDWMVSLESVGYYDETKGSQAYPPGIRLFYPSRGNFVAVVGNVVSRRLVDAFAESLRRRAGCPVEAGSLPGVVPGVGWSDHWSFWQSGVPAVMLTDTAPFRNPHYHRSTDTPETLDYDTLADLGAALPDVVLELAESGLALSWRFRAFLAWTGFLLGGGILLLGRAWRRRRNEKQLSRGGSPNPRDPRERIET